MERVFNAKCIWVSSCLRIVENVETTFYWMIGEWCVSNFETLPLTRYIREWNTVESEWWIVCVECGCIFVSSWENVAESKNQAFLNLVSATFWIESMYGTVINVKTKGIRTEITILRDVSNESVCGWFFFEFLNFWVCMPWIIYAMRDGIKKIVIFFFEIVSHMKDRTFKSMCCANPFQ